MRKKLPVVIGILLTFSVFLTTTQPAHAGITDLIGLDSIGEALGVTDTNSQKMSALDEVVKVGYLSCSILKVKKCEKVIGDPNDPDNAKSSVVGMLTTGVVAMTVTPVANPNIYIAHVRNNIGLVSPVNAQVQGIGFAGLSPLLDVWRGFRNIAYVFLIIIMITIGFMIMFRRRIDPRTVMTVQNALPRVVITLILVSFSYPIAGLLIDLMYLVIGIGFVAIFGVAGDVGAALGEVSNQSFPNLWKLFAIGGGSLDSIYSLFGGFVEGIIPGSGTGIATGIGGVVGLAALAVFTTPAVLLGGVFIAVIPFLIITLAVLFAALRLFFTLLNAYIQVLISVIFAPLLIMFGAIPGNNSFGNWIRNLVANLSVFVIMAIMLTLAGLLTADVFSRGTLWSPPGIAGNFAKDTAGLIGLGFALAIPNVAGAVKEALKAKPAVQGAGAGMLLGPIGSLTGAAQQGFGLFASFKQSGLLKK